MILTGSLCLSEIPKELCKKVLCKDGVERIYLNIAIFEKKQPSSFGDRTYTHSVSCAPPKENRKEGVNYYLGDLSVFERKPHQPSPDEINDSPAASVDDLPF